jgi:hypothetical protein
MAKIELRTLDPATDFNLFREAHNWRTRRSHRASGGQMPFKEFVAPNPAQAVMGLFNGEFLAAYLVREYALQHYDMHFTAKRQVPREYLVAGGIQLTSWLIKNGAIEVSALIVARNKALRMFLEDCGYKLERSTRFDNSPHEWLKFVA